MKPGRETDLSKVAVKTGADLLAQRFSVVQELSLLHNYLHGTLGREAEHWARRKPYG